MPGERNSQVCLQVLRQTAHAFSATLHEHDIIQIMLDQAIAATESEAALVRLLDPDGTALVLAGMVGLDDTGVIQPSVRVEDSLTAQQVLTGTVSLVADLTHEPALQPAVSSGAAARGMIAVPLSVRDRVIGMLQLYVEDVEDLTPVDIAAVETLTDLGALALERVRLHQSLLHIAAALNSSPELKTMLERVLEATVHEMGLKAASVRLFDSKAQILRLVAAYGLSQHYLEKGDIHIARSPIDARALQGDVVVLFDVEHEPGFEYPREATEEGIRSALVVPLHLKQTTIGIMRVYSAQPRHFGNVAVDFLTAVSKLVAVAIENAELYGALQARYEDLKLDLAEWYRFLALG